MTPIDAEREPQKKFHTDGLIDQITLAYSTVEDLLVRLNRECCAEDDGLVSIARICYRHACERATEIIKAVEKETGKIEVLVDTSLTDNIYDQPIKGVRIHQKEVSHA